ncbi:MAG: hypothetical protein ACRELF_12265 [Gemmataceae bacterium]
MNLSQSVTGMIMPGSPIGVVNSGLGTLTVVTAGTLSGHFDSIPAGMVETDTDTSSTVTQED